ncbi:hypothetical protein [Microbulbifer marinus]|uniref:Uncharacterized protein n=1 Tax=Microbulbifer marinus TaxID=658218 RepID=A0A1H3ZI77_9GAMM|nr:hypothetical protein [Microbulbifer marinus]SEA23433.1 hypothetical protein SAMN05216562_2413 [Microbulbifer marinus]
MYFDVVFTGELRTGVARRRGIEALARLFSLDFRQIKYLLSGACPVVKRVRERHQADRIVKALWGGGWHSELRQGDSILLRTNQLHGQGEPNAAAGMITAISADSSISLQLPASWQVCGGLNPHAILQAGDHGSRQYVVVLRQDRQELPEGLSLADYSAAQLHQCCTRVRGGDILSDPVPLEGAAYPTLVAQLHAELGGVSIRYFIGCLQWQQWYYTTYLWCESQDFRNSADLFEQVVRRIHMAPHS